MNKKITTSEGVFLFLEVSDDAYDFKINNVGCIRYSHNKGRENSPILPEQLGLYATTENVEIISTTKDITEEQAESVVQIVFDTPRLYANYLEPIGITHGIANTAKESLQSLIQANELDVNKNYLILKQTYG